MRLLNYGALMALIVFIDQVTKRWILYYGPQSYRVTSFLQFELSINRGISWGLFHDATPYSLVFIVLTSLIILLTVSFMVYSYKRFEQGYTIYGETFVIAGSLSNIIDRFVYGGVIDFIVLSWNTYIWPTFNLADVSIILGVVLLLVQHFLRK